MARRTLFLALVLIFAAATALAADYQVGSNDSLDIVVYDNPDLSSSVRVSANGTINFPLIGEIKVVGSTPRQIEGLIRNKLISGKFLKDPQVRVNVAQFKSQSVAVLGEVRNPGKFVIEGESSVLDILAEAGGLVRSAGDRVLLVKRGDDGGVALLAWHVQRRDAFVVGSKVHRCSCGKQCSNDGGGVGPFGVAAAWRSAPARRRARARSASTMAR